jgi:hypothetical protein
MDGAGREPAEIPLKAKYRERKPRGRYRADYNGNSGRSRHKHQLLPMVPGIKKKRNRRRI